MPTPFRPLALLALAAAAHAAPSVVIDDHFDNENPTGSAAAPGFWNIQTVQGDNGIFERGGFLTLFATGKPYTFACLNSTLDERLNFFRHAVTVTVEDFLLDSAKVPQKEAVFRLSLNSTELRQTVSPQSVSLRFVPGLALLGFKTAPVGKVDAENLQGTATGSACYEPFDGKLTAFSLTLDPGPAPGRITYTLTLRTDGSRPVITRTGVLALAAADWAEGGRSALVLEARRNTAGTDPDSYVSATLGRLSLISDIR